MTSWLSTSEVAALRGKSDRHIRRLAASGAFGECRRDGNAIEIPVASLNAQERASLSGQASIRAADELPAPILAFENASENQQRRATKRRTATVAYERFLLEWGDRRGLFATKERWAEQYALEHPELSGLSVDSLERWLSAYRSFGIDGLVDRNDGSSRRGATVLPSKVRNFFRETLKSGDAPNVARAVRDTRYWALDAGIDLDAIADDAFYRFAQTIPELELRATGAEQDKPSWMPSIRRDYTTLRALQVVQADHHIADVFVRCDDPSCHRGHRPWLTVFIDVRSRRVLSWIGALDYPNSERILKAFRALIEQHGIPEAAYIDNGKDFRKAFGKALRTWGAPALDEGYFNNLLTALGLRAIFATPYRAQSKTIERLFGTFVSRLWKGSAAYTGPLGKRTERVTRAFEDPQQLPTLTDFLALLDSEITIYNTDLGHRGHGMNGRSPLQVFDETRIPRRDPDQKGFALVFWQYHVRMVRGCTFTIGPDRYRLASEAIGFDYEGKYVQVLVNPEDVRSAIALTGCVHCKPEVRREKTAGCGCAGKGQFLCEAAMWDRSTFSFDDPITADNKKTLTRLERYWRERVRSGDPRARQMVEQFRQRRPEVLRRIAARRRAEQEPLVAAGGEERSTLLLPHSKLARELEETRALLENPLHLTAEERDLSRSIELPTNEELEALAMPRLYALPPAEPSCDVSAVLSELAIEERRREREEAGFCAVALDCPNPGPICQTHKQEISGE